ncbi:hypothetical protein OK074_3946 [Actinobacteria bacterium OK074]|nr:hypothetical protein OK074_3946 [Actinobacteria bacterium OK074]
MDRPRLDRLTGRQKAGIAAALTAVLGIALLPALDTADAPRPTKQAQPDSAGDRPLDETAAQQKARSTGRRVEATAERTATSTTYANPDGTFELVSHVTPVRAEVNGVWKAIDTTLEPAPGGGWTPKAVNSPVVFSPGGSHNSRTSRSGTGAHATTGTTTVHPAALVQDTTTSTDLVTFTTDGHELTVTWPGPLPEPVISANRALYQEVLPGVDLLLTARDGGFSDVLVVKSAEAAAGSALATLSYGLSSPDLSFTLDPATDSVLAKDPTGAEIAVSPTPYMWDSAGEIIDTDTSVADSSPEPSDDPTADESAEPSEDPEDSADPTASPTTNDYGDTAAPTDGSDGETPEAGTTTGADPAAYTYRAAAASDTEDTDGAEDTDNTDDAAAVLALDGLAGPQPGTHDAVADAELAKDGTLTVTPDTDLLTAGSTEYPVFIDPPFYGHVNNWTTAYQPYPSSSFWNGINFNDGTDSARVGYEATTQGLSRSFFQIDWDSKLKGAHISSASLNLLETYSWSCTDRSVELWRTGAISSKTTWNNQPSWTTQLDTRTVANGYNSSCPDDHVTFDATSIAQTASDGGWSVISLGLRAGNEESAVSWKKFKVSNDTPYLKATYNRVPAQPTSLTMTPGPDCDTSEPYASVGKSDLTFAANSTDKDGDLKYLDFEVWHNGEMDDKIVDTKKSVDANGRASLSVPSSSFADKKIYFWRVRAIDSTGAASTYAPNGSANCGFTYDSTAPTSPEVTSADFPQDNGTGATWSTLTFGNSGTVTFSDGGSGDTALYKYSVNSTSYGSEATPTKVGGSVTVPLSPPAAGPNVLYVKAVDSSKNSSEAMKYLFYVTPKDTADTAGDVTGDTYPDLFVVDEFNHLRLYNGTANGDIHASVPAAHNDGKLLAADDDTYGDYWTDALLTHNGDFLTGDGVQDLVARMSDGRLYVYPGDGYGGVDVSKRTEVLLPAGAPDPADLDQILAAGDIDNDGRPDLLATAGTQYWAFLGYSGGAFADAVLQNTGTAWTDRDLVSVGDFNADGEVDLLFRTLSTGRLTLRHGRTNGDGGTTLASLATAGASLDGADVVFAASGWTKAEVPMLSGTPDVSGNGVPDIWAIVPDGTARLFKLVSGGVLSSVEVISTDWSVKRAMG